MFDFIENQELRERVESEFKLSSETLKGELAESIKKDFEKETDGLRKSQQKLLDEKKKIQEKYAKISDPEEALRALQLINENEDFQMIRDGKFEDVIQRRVSTLTTQHEEAVNELNQKLETFEFDSAKYKSMYTDVIIDNNLRAAASKAGILPAALDDVLNKGRTLFSIAEDERSVESRDKNGKLRKTLDEKVLTPENWIESLKQTSPHYWPASRSAEFGPGGSGGDDLEAQILAAAKSGDSARYRKLREKQKGKSA